MEKVKLKYTKLILSSISLSETSILWEGHRILQKQRAEHWSQ